MPENDAMGLFHGMLLGFGLQQLPKVLQAIQKTQGGPQGTGAPPAGGGQGSPVPGMENIDIEQLLPLLMPLLGGQNATQPRQAGPVPGAPQPPAMGGTPPPMTAPPPSMGRLPTIPRVLPMSAGGNY